MSVLKNVSDERLEEIKKRDIVFDEDIPEFSEKQLEQFRPVNPQYFNITPKKKTICIKIDADILDAIKKDGPGYQTRINNILREAIFPA